MLRFGPDTGPLAIAALPLFEEANRTRQFTTTILRELARRGIGSVLPDFPGTGESLTAICDADIAMMRSAYEALAERLGRDRPIHAIGIRSGVLLDSHAAPKARWYLSPMTGEAVLRDLRRVRQAGLSSDARHDRDTMIDGDADYAGNRLSRAMLAELAVARPSDPAPRAPVRTIRLETDPRDATMKLPGTPLWRRAEPANDPALAERLAEDIAGWIAACAG